MRLLWLIVFLALACNASAYPAAVSFTDAQGHKINTANWRNKWVIINYWAPWCTACAEEIPQLNLFYRRHHPQTVLIGVNYDGLSGSNLLSAIHDMHIQFPVLQTNPAKTLGLSAVSVLPTTFIINPEGKVVKQLIGPQSNASLEEIVNARY